MLHVPSPGLAEEHRAGQGGEGVGCVRVPGGLCTDFGKRSLRLHDAAFVLVVMRVLKPESLLWSVFFQVRQLLAVDGSSALPVGTGKCHNSHRRGPRSPPIPNHPCRGAEPPCLEQGGILGG